MPYIKNPEENATFAFQCTKQWQDSLLISLHNFLASVFQVCSLLMVDLIVKTMFYQYMPVPTLAHYEEDANKILKLEQRNESLKTKLAQLIDRGTSEANVVPSQVDPPLPLLDDFYIIAQENHIVDSQGKSLKNIIRNMGTGSSPVMGRKDAGGIVKKRNVSMTRNS